MMPLDHDKVYKVTRYDDGEPSLETAFIALGTVHVPSKGLGKPDLVRFCKNGFVNYNGGFYGRVVRDEGDVMVFYDHDNLRSKEDVEWEFKPLTLEMWQQMWEDGAILGPQELYDGIQSTDALWAFYIADFLTDAWEELYESGFFQATYDEEVAHLK